MTDISPRHHAYSMQISKAKSEQGLSTPSTRSRTKISTVNIEFNSRRRVKNKDIDVNDAAYKINQFLKDFPCLFTQKLTYEKKNIQGLLDILSMECSIIPAACRGAYYNLIGYLYSALDKNDKTEAYFDMALKLNPDDIVAYTNKARHYLKQNEILKIYPLIRRLKEIKEKSNHLPGNYPMAIAQNTIALAYNKLGLSCAAIRFYEMTIKLDPLNCDSYLGKGEVLLKLSKHQGRVNALETLNEGIECLRKYITEYNVLNLAKERDARKSPLPRDNKAANNVFSVILLARALNERSRWLGKDYSIEAIEYIDLVLRHTDKNAYVLYQIGDEKRLMGEFGGEEGALCLLKEAVSIRECADIYHSYALTLLKWERRKYEERFNYQASRVTSRSSFTKDAGDDLMSPEQVRAEPRKKSVKALSSKSGKPKPFVFDGDNELKEGVIRVAKLLKYALKISYDECTTICLDLAQLYCTLNRKSEAEAMFRNVMTCSSVTHREVAFREFGRFLIKIGDFEKGDEMIDEALKLKSQVNHGSEIDKQLEETVFILSDHFNNENNGRGKYWTEKLTELNPEVLDEPNKLGLKSSKDRRK